MEIKDGGFSMKSKELKEDLYKLYSSLNDSSLSSNIKGDIDCIQAEEMLELMGNVSHLLNAQMNAIHSKIDGKRKTFIVKNKEKE